jgi:tRNA-dihydrouridine synthase
MILSFTLILMMIGILILQLLGAASVMVARGAMWNASIFSAKGKTPWEDVKREYVRKVFAFDFCFRMPLLHIRIMGKNIWR